MSITDIKRDQGPNVNIVRLTSTNTLAEVGTAGYLTAQLANIEAINNGAFQWEVSDMVLVYASDGWGFFTIAPDFTSLNAFVFVPGVTLPTVVGDFAQFDSTGGNLADNGLSPSDPAKTKVVMAGSSVRVNYIAKFADTAGTVDDSTSAAINDGNLQAGEGGVQGTLISYPPTNTNGSLIVAAIDAGGAFNTTISNSAMGQSTVYSIPDAGASTANFIISKLTGTQHITVGSLAIDTGDLSAGSSGHAGTVSSFPATAANGSLILAAANAGAAFNTTISNSTMGQSTVYSIPDIGAATGGIVVSTDARRMKAVDEAAAAGGAAAQSFTDTFCTSTSVVIGNWVTQANDASVLKIVPGNGSFVVTSSADAGVGTFSYIILK